MSTQLMTTTRLFYIGRHGTETSRLHSCYSNVVQMSMRGTKRDRHRCTEYWPNSMMAQGLVTLIRYSSYLSVARPFMHWITPSRLRSMWHHSMAAPMLRSYYSSVAHVSVSRTTRVRPPPKLRWRMVTGRSHDCCQSIRIVSRKCDIYRRAGLL